MAKINDVWGRDLDLNLLRVFAVVAEEGSLTRAAARLYVTQPAVSASVRRLATFVGTDLVTRQGHGVALTTRGAELLAAARAHLQPLVAATMAAPLFDPRLSTATIRLGLADGLEGAILPGLVAGLRAEAPAMRLVVLSVQFRTVEEMLLANKIDFAVTVADELPRSILRRPLGAHPGAPGGFVCLYDARFAKLTLPLTEREYFAQDHVVVSYAGDARGVVEDALGKSRTVRVSVPAFGHVADLVEGSSLVATVPSLFARHVVQVRPRLRTAALPFALEGSGLDLLWSRVTDDDAAARFFRDLVSRIVGAPEGEARGGSRAAKRRR
jgi:LysR family transcriptional regulator, mexEF-oprN operon transcriptional activator